MAPSCPHGAAYRDRYGLTGTHALGPEPQSDVQRADAAKAWRALGIARRLADQAQGIDGPQPSVPAAGRNLNRP